VKARLSCVVLAFFACGCAGQPPLREQAAGGAVLDLAALPHGYNNYTLFISTSYDYARLADTDDVKAVLAQRFKEFAAAIGPRSYAAFVGDPASQHLDAAAGRTVLDRATTKYGIKADYQDGPFIIVLREHPADATVAPGTPAAIALRGRSGQDIALILDELMVEIRKYQPKSGNSDPPGETLWQAVQRGWAAGGSSPAREWISILCACE
jgi:hypothetical protein